jgi:hypothetical protein
MAIAIDTLAYARRLREAGFTEQQAEGQAQALAAAMTDTLATKQDLQQLEARVDHDLHEFEARIHARFASIDLKFASVGSRFDSLDVRMSEMEKRFEYRLEAGLANLERRVTVRMLAGIGVFAALVKLT